MYSVSWGIQKQSSVTTFNLSYLLILLAVNHCWVTEYLGDGLANVYKKKFKSSHSTKSFMQSCSQYHLQMSNEQALTMGKVIHQSSKLKSNRIKLNADETEWKRN